MKKSQNQDHNHNRPATPRPNLKIWAEDKPKHQRIPTNMYSDKSGAHWLRYRSIIDTWYDPRDDNIVSTSEPITADIKVAYLNCDTLDDNNLEYILWFYEFHQIDVLFLIDTRLTVEGGFFENQRVKERLGNDFLVVHSAKRHVVGTGGQMAIIRPHLKKNYIGEETDPANLGVLFALTFRHDKQVLTLASVYWPCDNKGPGSLWTRLEEYMKDQNITGTVLGCIQCIANDWLRTYWIERWKTQATQ